MTTTDRIATKDEEAFNNRHMRRAMAARNTPQAIMQRDIKRQIELNHDQRKARAAAKRERIIEARRAAKAAKSQEPKPRTNKQLKRLGEHIRRMKEYRARHAKHAARASK